MAEKLQQTQIKRSILTPYQQQQSLELENNFQQLISKIQQTIIDTSESIKEKIFKFQQQQLNNFKQDLFKTQQNFIKVKQERNEETLKNNIMKQKNQVQQKFNIQMKKSLQMTNKYEEMKSQLKKMNDEQHQLILEINYIKKKIEKEKNQGANLDLQLVQMQNQIYRKSQQFKNPSKISQQMKLFNDLANKCGPNIHESSKINLKPKQQKSPSLNQDSSENYQNKTQNKLKQKINNLKDYIKNIPMQLTFLENKISQAIEKKKINKKIDEQNLKSSSQKEKIDEVIEQNGNLSTYQSDQNQQSVKQFSQVKFPIIGHKDKKILKSIKSTDYLIPCAKKNFKRLDKYSKFSSIGYQNLSDVNEKINRQKKISSLWWCISNPSQLLEQILQDPEVKVYLYKLMFN